MKIIEVISKGEVFRVKVDDADYTLLSRHKWYIMFVGSQNRPYAFTRFYTGHDAKNGKTFLMHHLIMGTSGAVDHIDNDSLNNQTSNLRVATYQENGWNKPKSKTIRGKEPASQYKGVSKYQNAKGETYWRVQFILTKKGEKPVRFFRKSKIMSENQAAQIYNEEVVKHRGQYAYLNQITP